ncbi:hypothetical protein R2980_002789 [Klebsiella oxytoca]|nr:hypothetical protein [Klebsiella oxytoca]HCB1751475.1 hypothetical protein [Klebsiella oxytoca]HCB1758196.1 hypothetical protein [Klebsiella oxytoca]HCB1839651.1 hypothetical protein [Klebsiella oxytoca]HCB1893700.1 hypothetical protein [Klebsiella oxytoca]
MISEIRAASSTDVREWFGQVPGTMQAVLLLVDGAPVAIGGMMRKSGFNVAFMDMKPEAHTVPLSVWRGSVRAMKDIIRKSRVPVYAKVSGELSTAPAFLRRLGFIPIDHNEEVMVCPVHGTQ